MWLVGWRKIARATDERTLIPLLLPRAGASDGGIVLVESMVEPELEAMLPALLGNFVLDYVCRNKVGGSTLQTYVGKQLPVLPPTELMEACPWGLGSTADWLRPRVVELTVTSYSMVAVATALGFPPAPFRWDSERRFLMRCELDAAFFYLYGLASDEVAYVMDTFPIVRDHDVKAHGEYRTKRVILEIHDEFAQAIERGVPYETRLDPPPADPGVAHPPRREVTFVS